MSVAVSVEHLTKKYKLYEDKWGPIKEVVSRKKLHKEFLALKDFSLDFPKGEAIGVLGKNGSGKSTLLKIITGIADPTSGKVSVNGSLVFLDVSSGIDAELTGYENIFMKGILLGYTKDEMLEKVDDIIEFSELGEFINQPVKNYSAGMKAKLGFAISVNVDPDILIVDEALAVGDSMFRAKCMNKMNQFKEQGKTIIFVSHDPNAVESFCSKAAWIHQGELITYGDSKLVGSIYNDFMAGRRTIEAIKSELQFIHAIEQVSATMTENGYSVQVGGYLYGKNETEAKSFELLLRDKRTGEYRSIPLSPAPYEGSSSLPESVKKHAGFSATVTENQLAGLLKPGSFVFSVRYRNEENQWTEFPLRSGAFTKMDSDSQEQTSGRFLYKMQVAASQLNLVVDNHDKVQQQVNKMWFEGNLLHVEGVAFIRGYETKTASDVSVSLHLVNMETFEQKTYPASMNETEEITENQAFNPQGKNYNYSQFNAVIDLSKLEPGQYESKLTYVMKNDPYHEFLILVWASKGKEYPSETKIIGDREIEIKTGSKYLKLEVRNHGYEEQ
ncbi:ABC transporter ATP-binding protein [Mesobacillus campisalis]|uniref:ABC transporter ATP-binding protein n=1 Tax=Mesobacillus campisalis TaxID=1408103 RepID=UPI00069C6C0E|nr:ABC transporter ATP-binding protein [Mesobacillus campisalis]